MVVSEKNKVTEKNLRWFSRGEADHHRAWRLEGIPAFPRDTNRKGAFPAPSAEAMAAVEHEQFLVSSGTNFARGGTGFLPGLAADICGLTGQRLNIAAQQLLPVPPREQGPARQRNI